MFNSMNPLPIEVGESSEEHEQRYDVIANKIAKIYLFKFIKNDENSSVQNNL